MIEVGIMRMDNKEDYPFLNKYTDVYVQDGLASMISADDIEELISAYKENPVGNDPEENLYLSNSGYHGGFFSGKNIAANVFEKDGSLYIILPSVEKNISQNIQTLEDVANQLLKMASQVPFNRVHTDFSMNGTSYGGSVRAAEATMLFINQLWGIASTQQQMVNAENVQDISAPLYAVYNMHDPDEHQLYSIVIERRDGDLYITSTKVE